MEYVKPSFIVIGQANGLFAWINGKIFIVNLDGVPCYATPAYDLDE